jgi:uncharacterized delta-60 repeat protein
VGPNQAPVNSVPVSQSTQVNTPLGFTDFRENRISTNDADAGLNSIKVTLTASRGLITLNYPDPNGGLTYSVGDGTEDATMTFTGKQTDINEALQWVVFRPEADYVGAAASLTITTNDQGYFGTGGIKEDVDTIPITVTAVPAFAASPTWTTLPGALDSTFDSDGMKTLSVSTGIDFIRQMKLLPDGKILAVGSVNNHFGIMRFNADLTLDATFGTNGVTETNLGDGQTAWEVIAHPDGGWIVSGTSRIARYTDNGILDTSFGTNGSVSNGHLNVSNSMAITPDGKLLVGGYDGAQFRTTRLTLSGQLESNWSRDEGLSQDYTRTRGLHVRDDGDIVFCGTRLYSGLYGTHHSSFRTSFQGVFEYGSFLSSDTYNNSAEASQQLPDGKILIIGQKNGDAYVSRWNADGNPDSSFGTNGFIAIPVLSASDSGFRVTLQADGKILLAGAAHNGSNWDIALVRMSYDGVLDPTLDGDGKLSVPFSAANDFGYAVLALPDGKIIIAGQTANDIALVRLYGDFNIFDEGNSPPTDLALSATSIAANQAVGTTVGTFTTTDPDAGNTFAYSLVTGTGSTDNAAFTIDGNSLKASTFNFESKSSYSIRVRTTDQGGLSFEKVFTIDVADVNEQVIFTSVGTGTVTENAAITTVIYTAVAIDPDTTAPNNNITYSIKLGVADAAFVTINEITGAVTLLASADFETKSSYLFTVVATDGGSPALSAENAVTVNVLNQVDGTVGNDAFVLTYSVSDVGVTLATNGAAATSLGTFPLDAPLTLFGLGGTDSVRVVGTSSADTFAVSSTGLTVNGASLILTSIENRTLAGMAGSDIYKFDADASLGLFTLDEAGGGTDTIDLSLTTTANINLSLDLGTGAAQVVHANLSLNLGSSTTFENINGGSGNDTLTGNLLANTLTGNGGNDTLTGNAGDDSLVGGLGDDTYVFGTATTAEADTVTEAANAGTDRLSFSSLTTDVMLSLETSIVQTVHANRTLKLNAGSVFENINGGSGNDTLTGNLLANILVGNSGNDTLRGGGGRDILIGGLGLDTLNSGEDEDIVIAGRTTSDALFSNLNRLMVEWVSVNAYATRISNLRAGVGAPAVSLKAKINVLNDTGEDDFLVGGNGTDWYFRSLDDVVTGLVTGEILDVL